MYKSNIAPMTEEEGNEIGGNGKYTKLREAFDALIMVYEERDGSTLCTLDKEVALLRFMREMKKLG